MKNPKRKIKKKTLLIFFVIVISLICIIYSVIHIFNWFKDNHKSNEIMNEIEEKITITQDASINATIIQNEDEIKKEDPY